jgi:hypothetical protein
MTISKFYLPVSYSYLTPDDVKNGSGFIYEHTTYQNIKDLADEIYTGQIEEIKYVFELDPANGTMRDVMVDICKIIYQKYIIEPDRSYKPDYDIEDMLDQHMPEWR